MMNSQQFSQAAVKAKPVTQCLKAQEDLLAELEDLLSKEHVALRHRDLDMLNAVSARKSSLMVTLQGNDQRIRLNPQAALLKTVYKGRVDAIKAALERCKRLNAVNGRLINLNLNATMRLSSVLMSTRDRSTMNMTYTDKGRTRASGPVRLSVEA
jgi:flagellar biosynthesis/type III secretory pathway chaperone